MTKIRKSAQGEQCTLNIAGVCRYESETVILAHIGFGDGGTAKRRQPGEVNAVYACAYCHDAIGEGKDVPGQGGKWFYIARGLVRTFQRRIEKGLNA